MKSIADWAARNARRRALAFCACFAAVLLISTDGFGQDKEKKTRKSRSEEIALQQMQNIAKAAATILNVYMDARVTETLALSSTCELLKDALVNPDSRSNADRVLAEWLKISGGHQAVLLLDKGGACLASAPEGLAKQSLSDDTAFKGAVAGRLSITDFHKSDITSSLDPKSNGWTLAIGAPIKAGNGVEGVLVSFLKWSSLAKTVMEVKVGESGYVYVLNGQNQVIIFPSANYYGIRLSDPKINLPELAEAVSKKAAYSSYVFVNPVTNRVDDKFVGFAYPQSTGNFPGLGWTVGAGADRSELLGIDSVLLVLLRRLVGQ